MGLIVLLIPIGVIVCIFLISHALSSIVVYRINKRHRFQNNDTTARLSTEQKNSIYNTVEIPINTEKTEEPKEITDHLVIQ